MNTQNAICLDRAKGVIGNSLAAPRQSTALTEPERTLTGEDLWQRAVSLAAALDRHPQLLVWSSRASDVVTALAACEAAGAELYLAHRAMGWPQVEALLKQLNISAVWKENEQSPSILDGSASLACEPGAVHLMTSGTTGSSKIARHHITGLIGAIRRTQNSAEARWLLAYPPTSFAGLQVVLTAVVGGGSLVVPAGTSPIEIRDALREHGITHMSGTPSLWRKLLLALEAGEQIPTLRHITLGGEAVDQSTLDRLSRQFPNARIRHIYATTEAGVLFTVSDHRAGFPAAFLEQGSDGVQFRIRDGVLEARSPRLMQRYVSQHNSPFSDDGWISTGDMLTVRDGRCYFKGRSDGRLNVGGHKVFPDQVEEAALTVEGVADARVYGQPGPLAGDVLIAEIVVGRGYEPLQVRDRLFSHWRANLPAYAVPRILRFCENIAISAFQKKVRQHGSH